MELFQKIIEITGNLFEQVNSCFSGHIVERAGENCAATRNCGRVRPDNLFFISYQYKLKHQAGDIKDRKQKVLMKCTG